MSILERKSSAMDASVASKVFLPFETSSAVVLVAVAAFSDLSWFLTTEKSRNKHARALLLSRCHHI